MRDNYDYDYCYHHHYFHYIIIVIIIVVVSYSFYNGSVCLLKYHSCFEMCLFVFYACL